MDERVIKHRYYQDGNAIFVAEFEIWSGNFWKVAGSDRLLKHYSNPQEAENALKTLHHEIIEKGR